MTKKAPLSTSEWGPFNPVLESALASMDIQIDDELARFRQKKGQQVSQTLPDAYSFVEKRNTSVSKTPLSFSINEASSTQEKTHAEVETPNLPPAPPTSSATPPKETPPIEQDYLESSEQLLKNLEESPPKKGPSSSKSRSRFPLLTPLGVGAVLILGTVLSLIGIAMLEPEVLSQLGFDRFLPQKQASNSEDTELSTVPEQPTTTPQAEPTETEPPQPSPPINTPNLASNELEGFDPDRIDTLESPGNLSNLPSPPPLAPPSPSPSPSPLVTQVTPGPSDLTTALLSPELEEPEELLPNASPSPSVSPIPTPQPSPEAENPSPTPTESPSPPAIEPNETVAPGPTQSDFYYVLMNYENADSLKKARTAVPDAYLREFSNGTKIQLGAFSNQEDAKKLLGDLESKGVPASIYRP